MSCEDILNLLEITDTERIDRQWRYLGNDKWIYSVALGIALGKKKFLYAMDADDGLSGISK